MTEPSPQRVERWVYERMPEGEVPGVYTYLGAEFICDANNAKGNVFYRRIPDPVPGLEARIAELEAERDGLRASNQRVMGSAWGKAIDDLQDLLAVRDQEIRKLKAVGDVVLLSRDHPEADGATPRYGDEQWEVTMPLEGDRKLSLRLGRKGRDLLFGMLVADCVDSREEEPSQPGSERSPT